MVIFVSFMWSVAERPIFCFDRILLLRCRCIDEQKNVFKRKENKSLQIWYIGCEMLGNISKTFDFMYNICNLKCIKRSFCFFMQNPWPLETIFDVQFVGKMNGYLPFCSTKIPPGITLLKGDINLAIFPKFQKYFFQMPIYKFKRWPQHQK